PQGIWIEHHGQRRPCQRLRGQCQTRDRHRQGRGEHLQESRRRVLREVTCSGLGAFAPAPSSPPVVVGPEQSKQTSVRRRKVVSRQFCSACPSERRATNRL